MNNIWYVESSRLLIFTCLHSIRIRLAWIVSVSPWGEFECPSPNVRKGTLFSSGRSVSIVTDDRILRWTFRISSGTPLETDVSLKGGRTNKTTNRFLCTQDYVYSLLKFKIIIIINNVHYITLKCKHCGIQYIVLFVNCKFQLRFQ